MNKEEFESFKKRYLTFFVKRYKKASRYAKKEIKKSIYENNKLSERQKDDFWNLVVMKK